MSSSSRTYYSQIDGLRCIAIVAVLLQHFAYFIGKKVYAGFFGVDLFFVLSGFLITEILLNQKEHVTQSKIFKNFYIRRSLRIFPIYYLATVCFYIFFADFRPIAPYAFFYVLNYAEFFTAWKIPFYASPFWSLSVEEQFYLVWPFVVVLIPTKHFKTVVWMMVLASIACFVITKLDHITPSRLFELCGGGLMAYYKLANETAYRSTLKKIAFYPIIVAVLIGVFSRELGISIISFWLVYLATTDSFKGRFKKFLEWSPVVYIGRISYGIYVYHKAVAYIVSILFFDAFWSNINFSFFPLLKWHSWIIKFPLFTILAILVASISYKFIELPILRLKKKFE